MVGWVSRWAPLHCWQPWSLSPQAAPWAARRPLKATATCRRSPHRAPSAKAAALARHQLANDRSPFDIEGVRRRLARRLAIPISCIGKIALDAMQVSVHPRRLGAVVAHEFMRFIPIVLAGPPQRL